MNTACNLAHLYIGEGEFDLAMILMQACEQEKVPFYMIGLLLQRRICLC